MIKKGFFTLFLLSGIVYSMGNTPNYDNKYDKEIEDRANNHVDESINENLSTTLSTLTIESLVFQEKLITDASGKKVKKNIPVKDVLRGSSVVYINRLTNRDSEIKTNIVVNNPIPQGTEYVKNSAICEEKCTISYSTDGGQTFSSSDDKDALYTDIKFHFSNIYPKKEIRMGFRATVK